MNWRRGGVILLISTMVLWAFVLQVRPALAYEEDTHYDLKYALALKMGFSELEAHTIASADLAVDTEPSTKAGFNKDNNKDWHAFELDGPQYEARKAQLWTRVIEAEDDDQLKKLGQYLHFVQDWFAHGAYGDVWGHAKDTYRGDDPDSLKDESGNKAAGSTNAMVRASLQAMADKLDHLGRTHPEVDDVMNDQDLKDLIADLKSQSDASWRKGACHGFNKQGEKILEENKKRIDKYITEVLGKASAEKPKVIKYDEAGDPMEIASVPDHAIRSDIALLDYELNSVTATIVEADAILINLGEVPTAPGTLTLTAVNNATDELIGQLEVPLPPVGPGDTISVPLSITRSQELPPEHLIEVFAHVDDMNAKNNQGWFVVPPYGGGIAEPLAGGSNAPVRVGDGSGGSFPYAAVAAAGALVLAASGWYVWRRRDHLPL